MLAMSDIDINQFIPVFAELGISVAFLVPTPTGYNKSIMDATAPVRDLLKYARVHDYDKQGQGQENKVMVKSYFVKSDGLIETAASLYRPVTKKGDPRIWFSNMRGYCSPCNLLALVILDGCIYVVNLSDPANYASLQKHQYVYEIFQEVAYRDAAISLELLHKIQLIHNQGFLPSITPGDPGVGDTLEHALGIQRNNSKLPDYKGIELKASRLTRNGSMRPPTRQNLFAKVPDIGMTYRQIVDNFGKVQVPRGQTVARLQIFDTLRASKPNAYDLMLQVDSGADKLNMLHVPYKEVGTAISAWFLQGLRETLLTKHHETFWVKAVSVNREGREFFRYDRILHTKSPNVSLLAPLLETDKITVDLLAYYKPDGKWRDHGMLFKMKPDDLPLLLGTPKVYDLTV